MRASATGSNKQIPKLSNDRKAKVSCGIWNCLGVMISTELSHAMLHTQLPKLGYDFQLHYQGIKRVGDGWNDHLEKLIKYKGANDGSYPPRSDKTMSEWVKTQQERYRKGMLKKDRLDRLKNAGFSFIAKNEQAIENCRRWNDRLKEFIEYRSINDGNKPHFNCSVLRKWASSQRKHYHQRTLDQDREKKLKDAGFNFL